VALNLCGIYSILKRIVRTSISGGAIPATRPRFRQMQTLQKFVAVHSSVHNHFNQERHLHSRCNFKLNRAAALAEWRQLGAT
jgi:hypothetical protein